jgi:hypothetical protein
VADTYYRFQINDAENFTNLNFDTRHPANDTEAETLAGAWANLTGAGNVTVQKITTEDPTTVQVYP